MNRFFALFLAASGLTAVGQVPDYVPTEGLVAWYSLDDNGQDEWGGNNPDYYSATPTTNRFGAPNRALNFQEGEEQFIRGEASGFPISDRTVAFWMKTTFEFGKTWPFGYGGGPSCNTGVGRSSVLYFNTNDCGAAGKVAHTAHCCTSVLTSSFNSSTDWTFWCYTNDANGLRIYQNGELIGVGASAEDVQTSSAKFFIGSAVSGDGTSRYAQFTGALDDLGLWDRALTEDEISELYSSIQGCVDELACNYNGDPEVISLPESCDYSCCPGPGCCHEGTIWDSDLQQCIVDESACGWQPDGNGDNLIGVNDLLDLLGVYGDTDYDQDGIWDSADDCVGEYDECGVCNGSGPSIPIVESIEILYDSVYAEPIDEWLVFEVGADTTFSYTCFEWQCGDPLEYQGYDYETVQIGEQCWFAENVRHLPEVSPPSVGSVEQAHAYVMNYSGSDEQFARTTIEYLEYGVLYNYEAIQVWELCPSGWRSPNISDLTALVSPFGGLDSAGEELKSTLIGGNNVTGFNAKAGGYRNEGSFGLEGVYGLFWMPQDEAYFDIYFDNDDVDIYYIIENYGNFDRSRGMSVRCIKDAE